MNAPYTHSPKPLALLPEFLADWRTDYPDHIALIDEGVRDATIRRARLTLAETPLSIGVMGQVKAGKSSFLNSLLFGGRPLLPEAATPKTANLTRIRYAATPQFTARFYRPEDWALIERQAACGGSDDASKAAGELVKAARNSGIDIARLLAQGEITLVAATLDQLLGQLNNYVGNDGLCSALVAETELALPLEELIGIEIVDTPGMNDPVVSRSDKTRQYMAQCDVVFFLSRASQFLEASDQLLMTRQLPQKGIKRLILVAAQFDMAVQDDGFNRKSFALCQSRLIERLTQRAQTVFTELANQREKQGFPHTAALLRSAGNPIFSSTHAWIIAHQPQAQWRDEVFNTFENLTELATDRWKSTLETDHWAQLGNLEPLTMALNQAKADKELLLAQQRTGLEDELSVLLNDLLQQLRESAASDLHVIQHSDLASLEARERTEQGQLNKISQALSGFLQHTIAQTQERSSQLTSEMNACAARAGRLDERTGHKHSRHSITVSDAVWYNPFTWLSSHEEHYSESNAYRYLAVSDAIENLRYYIMTARRQLLSGFDDLIAPATLSAGLRRELLRNIAPNTPDFDPRSLRGLIGTSLARLQLPELDFDAPSTEGIFSGFSGEIKSHSDMQRLRDKLDGSVRDLNTTLVNRLSASVNDVSQTLDGIAVHLQEQLTARLAEEIVRLRAAMANKEQHLTRLETLIANIDTITPPTSGDQHE